MKKSLMAILTATIIALSSLVPLFSSGYKSIRMRNKKSDMVAQDSIFEIHKGQIQLSVLVL